ncbi:restriction endonuclease subunit S [Thiofilum flexile]|uniref:restriction endonuclease subunit S n=1 Tax=Thiofilum flexile TaxID=125627 RepID=UPI00035DE867|nr:restriction endonuclease subunit S [Thiofilum flexile]
MSANWPIVRLGDYCLKVGSGSTPTGGANVYLDKGDFFFIRSQNIYNEGFKADGLVFISEEAAEKLKNVSVNENDILLNITGDSVARVCLAKKKYLPARVNQHVLIIRPDQKEFDPRYLNYLLASPKMQSLLLSIAAVGATRNALTKSMIESLDVPKPELKIQKAIANKLIILDEKIELNTQTNQTLEQIAQAIFKSWFVDFDPVKAKMTTLAAGGSREEAERAAMSAISGKDEAALDAMQHEQPAAYAELAATAALFPAAMQASELGDVPEGWEVSKVEKILTLAYGKALRKEHRSTGDYPVYGSGGVNGTHNEALVNGPGIIIGRKGTIGSIYWEDNSFFPIDTVFYVNPCDGIPLSYIYHLLETLGLKNMNTDAAVPGLNRNNVYRLEIVKPSVKVLKKFNFIQTSIRSKISISIDENNKLIELRDSLLPKLLSGEIDLSNLPDLIETT